MTVKIHGNQYVTVAERMELLRSTQKPYEIIESLPIQIGERCVWRVTVLIEDLRYMGSAEVHFNAKPGTADATDPFACAETSAIGRALGFAGFGAIEAIASADEIVRTEQPKTKPVQVTNSLNAPSPFELERMFKGIQQSLDIAQQKKFGKVYPVDNLTPEQCADLKALYDHWKAGYDTRQKAS